MPSSGIDLQESTSSTATGHHGGTNTAAVDEEAVISSISPVQERPPPKSCYERCIKPWLNVGDLSNLATFCVFVVGIVLSMFIFPQSENSPASKASEYVLSFGLFGFAGGITNWLAVKMLFDRIPCLYGSGVIPRQFKEIREMVKATMLKTFFNRQFLVTYAIEKLGAFQNSNDIEGSIRRLLESDAVDTIIEQNLTNLNTTAEGEMMTKMGMSPAAMKPMVKPMVVNMASEAAPMLMSQFKPETLAEPVDKFIAGIDSLMEMKLQEMTPEKVKELMETVIREHLGWLIVWGNVFGGAIGVISTAAGYGSDNDMYSVDSNTTSLLAYEVGVGSGIPAYQVGIDGMRPPLASRFMLCLWAYIFSG